MSKQTNCHETWIFIHGVHSTGVAAGQMYTYPARCWRKKRRLHNSTDPRLGIYGLQLGKTLQPLLGMSPAHRSLLHSASPPTQPAPPRSPPTSFSSCDYWWWSGIISLKVSLSAMSRAGCQSFFRGWNVAVFTTAGKLVLWEVEHVIRFTAAGSSETEFGHCRQYLINVMEWSLVFSDCHLKHLTQHIYPLYILTPSYFLLATCLADWVCLFLSGNSFIFLSL